MTNKNFTKKTEAISSAPEGLVVPTPLRVTAAANPTKR